MERLRELKAVGNEAGKHALVSLLALPLRDGDARAKTHAAKGRESVCEWVCVCV